MSYALIKPLAEMDYPAVETRAKFKHEIVGGSTHALAGASEQPNTMAGNLFAACHAAWGGSQCRPLMDDMRLSLRHGQA